MNDEWGGDPSVRFMRRVFKSMEETQKRLLADLKISHSDPRLRHWRETSRDLFEHVWPIAIRRGVASSDKEAGALYAHCIARTLRSDGIEIPHDAVPLDETFPRLVQEVKP